MGEVFASAMGQYDNVGDTVLRRPFLRALRDAGPLNVFIGTRSDEYLSALGLSGDERLFRDSNAWRKAISREMIRGGMTYAFNAGEIEVTRPYAAHYLRLAPLLAASKLRGGRAIHVGLGVRRPTRWIPAVRATLRLCDAVSWRDDMSRKVVSLGTTAPDWAFAEGAPNDQLDQRAQDMSRSSLVFAPRYNGIQPDDEWCARFAQAATSLNLRIVVAAQIQRDNPVAEELARKWDAEAVLWDDADHSRQEHKLRLAYSGARVVVSERLHALVIGATEGAVPVALGTSPADKALRTIDGAGLAPLYITPTSVDDAILDALTTASVQSGKLATSVRRARAELDEMKARIHALIA
ncbi:polysaccharide pyruvyl transferase family protein [Microbacterium paludicola]|uniref:polysaccharide pyruvyl transferase family protein n=1 Tax=Microbacterium paludicola TaxID=300019 RepID=UPI0011AA39A7|nr:polysaccharide pyruvyl transferase family protein [Microbacterium paludicola]